ncbi:hypothetical protein GO491_01430 [Flavobacteriaceae bacterium Ap0902]|nr:hypothetical protein [Flavobacteriaceae bacterium Ap0902]
MKLSVFLLVLMLLFSSCSDDDGCAHTTLDTYSIEEIYGCENTYESLTLKDNQDYYFITNAADYNEIVDTTCDFSIDFNKYDLIIGTRANFPSEYELYRTCRKDEVNLKLIFSANDNPTTESYLFTFHVLVEKGIIKESDNIIISNVYTGS